MLTGTVTFFSGKLGEGAIAPDGGGPAVFAHVTAIERAGIGALVKGQRVSFEIVRDKASGSSAAFNFQNLKPGH